MLTEFEVEALWNLLAHDIQNLRDLVNGDVYHISRFAEDTFKKLREYYNAPDSS